MLTKVKRNIRKQLTKRLFPNYFYFLHKGYCPCCDKEVEFESYHHWLRDHFVCKNCNSIPRERALMLAIDKYYSNWRDLVIHESSPINRGTSLKLKNNCKNYIASQYYPDIKAGEIVNGFRCEDLENQSFNDESFDIVITQYVMEHVYDPARAFKEIGRTLKKGGAHIFTVPIINKHNPTEIWATKSDNGSPIFLKEPEYHGNPVNEEGSPVTMHWGYDIVDFIHQNSGLKTEIEYIDNLDYGIRAEYIEVLVSQKVV